MHHRNLAKQTHAAVQHVRTCWRTMYELINSCACVEWPKIYRWGKVASSTGKNAKLFHKVLLPANIIKSSQFIYNRILCVVYLWIHDVHEGGHEEHFTNGDNRYSQHLQYCSGFLSKRATKKVQFYPTSAMQCTKPCSH